MKRLSESLSVVLTILIPVFGLPLSGCGFHPVYGVNKYTATSVESQLDQIAIGTIPNREGQFLRNALVSRFHRSGAPADARYTLDVEPINESLTDLDITKDAESTRGQLRLSTTMRLSDRTTGATVVEYPLTTIASYNILAGEFTNRVSEQNARENALGDLARQIEQRLALYLKRAQ